MWIQKRAFLTEFCFKLIKELAKIFRYIWSSRVRIYGPQQSIWRSSQWPSLCETCWQWFWQYGWSHYLTNCSQRVKLESTFSSCLAILWCVWQGSILELILNLFINYLTLQFCRWYCHIFMYIKLRTLNYSTSKIIKRHAYCSKLILNC